ncbi:efflux transporter outer membrane subunit [Methylomonas rhizoryzae]|uniref:efflux transporter outer membrane subunit n=1 Tax=Methylomonas rhizoryzae TaxID=2608981 RepID=UPI001232E5AC|nr:efflux transporter outer membrane subunit [Methylomonas rhizoryzae]
MNAKPSAFVTHALLAAASLALTGCAVGPDFQTPDSHPPAGFANGETSPYSDNPVDLLWWRGFNDPQLTDLVELALAHNRELKAAQANLREARALYLQAGLQLAPVISAHANYTEQKRSSGALNNRNFVPRELKLYNTGFDASWELDFFGRVRRNVEASNDEVDAQLASLHDIGISLIAEVARNYFELRGLQLQRQVAEQNVANQQQTLTITQAKFTNGRGTPLDVARADAQLNATRAGLPDLDASLKQAIHRLSVLCGEMPYALAARLTPHAALPKAPELIGIGNPADLLRRRPDIRSAERTLAAATARIGVATADLFPRVSFVGSISLEATTLSGLVAPGSESYSIGPKISWAALDLGRVYAQIKAADARAEASLANYEQTVLTALEDTENALVNYGEQRRRRDLLAQAEASSRQARELAQLQYREGLTDFLTVLDAESRLLQDQTRLAQSETATASALTAVYKALGGGWQAVPDGDQQEALAVSNEQLR